MKYDKTLIWIDDSSNRMEPIARKVFFELWIDGIFSKTVFLGDFVKKVELKTLSRYQVLVNDLFYFFCTKYGIVSKSSKDRYPKWKALYDTYESKGQLEDIAISLHANDKPAITNKIDTLLQSWKQLSDAKEVWGENFDTTNMKYNVDFIFESIKGANQFAYALDLILLKGDEEKLNCAKEKSIPIISLELYHYITSNLNAKCLLYSSDTCLNRVPNNWKTLYQKRYGEMPVDIIPRTLLNRGSIDPSKIDLFKSLF